MSRWDNEAQMMIDLWKIVRGSPTRAGIDVAGMPGNPDSRHVCHLCGHKRYERFMIPTGKTLANNCKIWLLWRCKACKVRMKT